MKRGAAAQLTRDDAEAEDARDTNDAEDEGATGLRRADDAVLATRKIRALPKRAGAAPAPAAPAAAAPAPKFGGFGGFGATPAPAPAAAPAPKFSGFGAPSTASPFSAPSATSAFASLVASTKPAPSPSPSSPSSTEDGAVKYYTSLRGLNASFVRALSAAVDADPFRDLAALVEQYAAHRLAVQAERDSAANTTPPSSQSAPAPAPAPPKAPGAMPTPPGSFSFGGAPVKPAAPAASTGGGFTPSATAAPASGGFGFPPAKKSEPAPAPAPSSETKEAEKEKKEEKPAPSSLFGSSKGTGAFGSSSITDTSNPSVFGSGAGLAKPDIGGSGIFAKPDAPVPAPANPFAKSGPQTSTLFGSSSPSSSLFASTVEKAAASASSSEKPSLSPSTSNPFSTTLPGAASSASLFGVSGAPTTPGAEKSGFSFGAAGGGAGAKKGGFTGFGFGSATGDASPPAARTPPVGFSFGAPPPKPVFSSSSTEDEKKEEPKSAGFSFGGAGGGFGSAFGSSGGGLFGGGGGSAFGSGSGSGAASPFGAPRAGGGASPFGSTPIAGGGGGFSFGAPPKPSPSPAPTDAGAAEEGASADEPGAARDYDRADDAAGAPASRVKLRAKLFRFRAAKGEEPAGWAELGVGYFRVREDGGKRSAFFRNSSTGRVVLNFVVGASTAPSALSKKSVTLDGVAAGEEGRPARFMLRFGALDEAERAHKEIEDARAGGA